MYFPDIHEESFFVTKDGCSMLSYAAENKAQIEQPHIFAHQRDVMRRKGLGIDAYTAHNYQRQSSQMMSFHSHPLSKGCALQGGVVDYTGDLCWTAKKNLHTRKRVLYIRKRALYICQKFPYICESTLLLILKICNLHWEPRTEEIMVKKIGNGIKHLGQNELTNHFS